MTNTATPFWQTKPLLEMNHEEWESICDGCAKCCLHQLEDEETEQLVFTDVACNLLDDETCRCTDYQNRSTRVPSCMTLSADNVAECAEFAPESCSYRLLLEGEELPDWHHLKTGDSNSVHVAGASVANRVRKFSEIQADDLEDYVVDWP